MLKAEKLRYRISVEKFIIGVLIFMHNKFIRHRKNHNKLPNINKKYKFIFQS